MNSVLVFRSAALGDFILALPALNQVRRQFPGRKIVLLTTQSGAKSQRAKVAGYAGGPNSVPWVGLASPHLIDDTFVLQDVSDVVAVRDLRRQLRAAYVFEAAVVMLDPCAPWLGRVKKLLLLKFLVGRVPLLGWRGRGSLNGDVRTLKRDGLLRHHVHGPLQFLNEMKPPRRYTDQDVVFDLRPDLDARRWADAWISGRHLSASRLVVIAPGSIQPHKCWPEASFSALIGELLAEFADLVIALVGAAKDALIGETFARLSPARVFNLIGSTSIAQSAALMGRAALVVGNDGGAMHLADAMGAPVISLIPGIEYPDSIEPWHNKTLAIRIPVPCAPCYSFEYCPQGHQRCMNEIPVSLVLERCRSVLDGTLAARKKLLLAA